MARFTGSFNLTDKQALVRALGQASDSQLTFWANCAKSQHLTHQHGLILAEMADRSVEEYGRHFDAAIDRDNFRHPIE